MKGDYPLGVSAKDFDDGFEPELITINVELTEAEYHALEKMSHLNSAILNPITKNILHDIFLQIVAK